MSFPIFRPALAIGALLAVGACSSYGDGYGYGGRVSYGYNSGGRYSDDFYQPYYSGYYGWGGDYYYPGTGFYLYDRSGKRHRWNDSQRRYWEGRRGDSREPTENWGGYRDHEGRDYREYRGNGHDRDRHKRPR
ncbi:MAG: hypothetical protein P0Y56_00070 [Candidatus Andeanibacterium colombiense]|uniref:Peptidase n=1 Tax=Candidatus Andeanibacterium colombiense TaxID=3121345 RepID=A0AAJ5X8T1_9SPHN|nr:MAG: hypothetical protein P0Y56_00070 [Sphingomonadaceae bacterium]